MLMVQKIAMNFWHLANTGMHVQSESSLKSICKKNLLRNDELKFHDVSILALWNSNENYFLCIDKIAVMYTVFSLLWPKKNQQINFNKCCSLAEEGTCLKCTYYIASFSSAQINMDMMESVCEKKRGTFIFWACVFFPMVVGSRPFYSDFSY